MSDQERTPGLLSANERQLRKTFLDEAQLVPGGDKITRCIQCGTCTGSCPVAYAMDLSPRTLVALFRAGQMEKILRSRTIWICASCYMCTTRCPQRIRITDILYALKRTSMESGLYPERYPVHRLSRIFVNMVNRYGRNHELQLLLRYYLRRNPLELLRLIPLGFSLYRRGRVALFPSRVKGVGTIRRILEASQDLQLPRDEEPAGYETGTVGYSAVDSLVARSSA